MSTAFRIAVLRDLPSGIGELRAEAAAEGFRFMDRLVMEWHFRPERTNRRPSREIGEQAPGIAPRTRLRSFYVQNDDGQEQCTAGDENSQRGEDEFLHRAELFAGFIRPFAIRSPASRQRRTLRIHRYLHFHFTDGDIVRRPPGHKRISRGLP